LHLTSEMVIKTLFTQGNQFIPGEVEVRLLPGIPVLHVVGQPDGHIRESGLRLKSALRACQLQWPKGHQIVVNLRPTHFRKSSSGVDLAIALGFLALTQQLSRDLLARLQECVVYGEVALDGCVFAPADLGEALRTNELAFISGEPNGAVPIGRWWKLKTLSDSRLISEERQAQWNWQVPEFPDISFPESSFRRLCLAAHLQLNVLLAGPQGSGKSTWAKALYALSDRPDEAQILEQQSLFGADPERTWRPCEVPHHLITPLAMVGGGAPLFPGVISRAHGGMLIMDEFLEFHPAVLEALREPLQNGYIELARRGERQRFPARFQLVGTTNLCPCGQFRPGKSVSCGRSLRHCQSVVTRLSGPVLDRFDLFLFSHKWLRNEPLRSWSEAQGEVQRLRQFARKHPAEVPLLPEWIQQLELSHRRRAAVLRVARGLADWDECPQVQPQHFGEAHDWVVKPMEVLRQLFA
jgi:magnesium chelatase family protein